MVVVDVSACAESVFVCWSEGSTREDDLGRRHFDVLDVCWWRVGRGEVFVAGIRSGFLTQTRKLNISNRIALFSDSSSHPPSSDLLSLVQCGFWC